MSGSPGTHRLGRIANRNMVTYPYRQTRRIVYFGTDVKGAMRNTLFRPNFHNRLQGISRARAAPWGDLARGRRPAQPIPPTPLQAGLKRPLPPFQRRHTERGNVAPGIQRKRAVENHRPSPFNPCGPAYSPEALSIVTDTPGPIVELRLIFFR